MRWSALLLAASLLTVLAATPVDAGATDDADDGDASAPTCVPNGRPTRACVDGDCVYVVQDGRVVAWTVTCE